MVPLNDPDVVSTSKVFPKFLSALGQQPAPVLLDLGPVVGSNITFFGERLGCKIIVEDLFGDLEQRSVAFEVRTSYTLSPTLSFQLFAQPLLSAGDYVAYKQLAAPDSYDFVGFREGTPVGIGGGVACAGGAICRDAAGAQHVDFNGDGVGDYAFADRDFNVRSLIGNAVLRWEYRPGSTIFLVWQRQQDDEARVGDFDLPRDFDALWGSPAHNRFIVKVNYWLGL